MVVIEGPKWTPTEGPRVVRAPRVPTQAEIEAHMATHIPHEEWCEFCMKGRGRNSVHKRKKGGEEGNGDAHEEATSEEEPGKAPVPRVCMGYF